LIAAGIRLGIPPFNSQYLPEKPIRLGKLTLLHLALPAASLPIIVRIALHSSLSLTPTFSLYVWPGCIIE